MLDCSAVSELSERSTRAAARVVRLRAEGRWPPLVPSVVLVEALSGVAGKDAPANRFPKACEVTDAPDEQLARRAASLRHRAGRGSAVDALAVAAAEPDGAVLTQDLGDLQALAAHGKGFGSREREGGAPRSLSSPYTAAMLTPPSAPARWTVRPTSSSTSAEARASGSSRRP